MWIKLFHIFTKVTAWPVQKLAFRTRIVYEDKALQSRRIKGPAILISNHTSVWDYAVWLFVFLGRTLRFQMAELLFEKPVLGIFLRAMGGIRVDRNAFDFGFLAKSEAVLRKGGVVGIFPEGRIPKPGEQRPLEYKPSAAWLALQSGMPMIPVFTDGSYFRKKRASAIIGTPLYAQDLAKGASSEKEAIVQVNEALRQRMIELERILHERTT